MIIINLPNSSPYTYGTGMAVKSLGPTLPKIATRPILDFCFCKYECEYYEKVFAKVGGEDFENDKRSFIYQKIIDTDTIVMKLFKDDVELATLNDDTYGTFYDFGDFDNPLYIGYLLDFEKVFSIDGPGIYQIKTTATIIGSSDEITSNKYTLMPFSEERSNDTVKIEWYQNGNILSSLFDFTDLNWYQAIRVPGKFGNKQPKIEKDFYITEDYEREQIQYNTLTTYELSTKLLPSSISNKIYYDMGFANKILITDYNIFNNEIFRSKEVDIETYENATYFGRNTNAIHKLTFTDRFETDKKRNY